MSTCQSARPEARRNALQSSDRAIERPGAAGSVLDLLLEAYPDTGEAELARVERIDLDGGLTTQARIAALREVVEGAGDPDTIKGRIEQIGRDLAALAATRVLEADGRLLLPGMIDDQVHFREPGLCFLVLVVAGYRIRILRRRLPCR